MEVRHREYALQCVGEKIGEFIELGGTLAMVLANLDGAVGEARRSGVQVERVGAFLAAVGLVVADLQMLALTQDLDQRNGDARIPVPQHAQIPEPVPTAQRRREGMHREEQRLRPASAKPRERLIDRVVIRPMEGLRTCLLLLDSELEITGNDDAVTDVENRLRVARLTVEVDDQTRVAGEHRRRAETP